MSKGLVTQLQVSSSNVYIGCMSHQLGKVSIQQNAKVPFGNMLLIKRVQYFAELTNKCLLVLYLSISFRYLVELKLLQNLKNKTTWV